MYACAKYLLKKPSKICENCRVNSPYKIFRVASSLNIVNGKKTQFVKSGMHFAFGIYLNSDVYILFLWNDTKTSYIIWNIIHPIAVYNLVIKHLSMCWMINGKQKLIHDSVFLLCVVSFPLNQYTCSCSNIFIFSLSMALQPFGL
jgi:hypothetical protein